MLLIATLRPLRRVDAQVLTRVVVLVPLVLLKSMQHYPTVVHPESAVQVAVTVAVWRNLSIPRKSFCAVTAVTARKARVTRVADLYI